MLGHAQWYVAQRAQIGQTTDMLWCLKYSLPIVMQE